MRLRLVAPLCEVPNVELFVVGELWWLGVLEEVLRKGEGIEGDREVSLVRVFWEMGCKPYIGRC